MNKVIGNGAGASVQDFFLASRVKKTENGAGNFPVTEGASSDGAGTVLLRLDVNGRTLEVKDPAHADHIKRFLSGGENRMETVAAVLYKEIEPTEENLELVHRALNEELYPSEERTLEEPDLPVDRLKRAVRNRDADPILRRGSDDFVAEAVSEGREVSEEVRSQSVEKRIFDLIAELVREAVGDSAKAGADAATGTDVAGAAAETAEAARGMYADAAGAFRIGVGMGTADASQPDVESAGSAFLLGEMSPRREDVVLESDAEGFSGEMPERASAALAASASARADISSARSLPETGDAANSGDLRARAGSEHIVPDAGTKPDFSEYGEIRSSEDEAKNPDRELPRAVRSDSEDEAKETAQEDRATFLLIRQALAGLESGIDAVLRDLDVRRVLSTQITEMTQRATEEFRVFQSGALKALDKMSVQSAIEHLTKAINKSTFALLADMKTEKTLLVSIAKLEDASSLLKNRQFEAADKLVREVAKTLSGLSFKPTVRKLHAMVAQKVITNVRAASEQPVTMREKIAEAHTLFSSGTARDMLELARFSGINHEIETYEASSGVGDLKNLKELFQDSAFFGELSGRQMLNDSQQDRRRNFYVLEIPMEIQDEVSGLKVFVSGKCDDHVIDWKNTELYFGLQMKEERRIGLRFSIRGAAVGIDVMSDVPLDLEGIQRILPDLGYTLTSIRQKAYQTPVRIPHSASEMGKDDCPDGRADTEESAVAVHPGRFDMKI